MIMVRVVTMVATDVKTGAIITEGDTVFSSRGEEARFVAATDPTVPGRAGKVAVDWASDGTRGYYYAKVFGLQVSGIMSCGCPVGPEHPGHLDGCNAE